MDYYSEVKINELSSYKRTWMNLKSTLLSERSLSEKATRVYDFIYVTFWKRQNEGDRKRISGRPWVGNEGE